MEEILGGYLGNYAEIYTCLCIRHQPGKLSELERIFKELAYMDRRLGVKYGR